MAFRKIGHSSQRHSHSRRKKNTRGRGLLFKPVVEPAPPWAALAVLFRLAAVVAAKDKNKEQEHQQRHISCQSASICSLAPISAKVYIAPYANCAAETRISGRCSGQQSLQGSSTVVQISSS
jgi:hypothetical protein